MASLFRNYWALVAVAIGIAAIVAINISYYEWNITSMFHLDHTIADVHPLQPGFVILEMPGYDGAQYYQVARNLPMLFAPSRWSELTTHIPLSYAYQRILLPVVAYGVSFGKEAALPYAFLIINIFSLVLATWIIFKHSGGKWLPTLAFAFCPSAMVGLHFVLAEPLALLILALFLTRYTKLQKLGWIDILLLALLVLSREVNILFAGIVLVYSLYKQQWKDAALALIPIAVFLALHGLLYQIFGDIPFLTSAGARQFPFSAPLKVLLGMRGYDMYTLSSVALFLGFTLPAFVWSIYRIIKGDRSFPTFGLFLFLCLMLTLADYIWGSITSVGRVITPMYPLAIVAFMNADSRIAQLITLAILLIGLGAGLGLAFIVHPFTLS